MWGKRRFVVSTLMTRYLHSTPTPHSLFTLSVAMFSVLPPPRPFTCKPRFQAGLCTRIQCVSTQVGAISLPTTPTKDDVEQFWQWFINKSTKGKKPPTHLARPQVVPQRLGLVAMRDISKGDVVVEVPKNLWINMDVVMSSTIGNLFKDARPWVAISIFLINEKSISDSPWAPYLNILPHTLDSPMFWSEEELQEIQGTQLLSSTIGYKNFLESEFLKLKEEIIDPNENLFNVNISKDDFFWAFGILKSRSFPPFTGDKLTLVPCADMVNHDPTIPASSSCWEVKLGGIFGGQESMIMKSQSFFRSGEQVMMQYGREKSNGELALDYGIIERYNESRDVYTLSCEISELDAFLDDKIDIAEMNEMGRSEYFDIGPGEARVGESRMIMEKMMPYLRLVALGGSDAFLLEALFRDKVWTHLSLPVSQSNEEAVCRVVLDGCISALDAYPTSIQEDEALLEETLDPRHEIAVVTRLWEKKILHQLKDSFEEYIANIEDLEYYQERRLKSLGLVGEKGDIVFWE